MDIRTLFAHFRMGPGDITGLDLGTSAIKAAHLRRSAEGISLIGAQLLPPLDDMPGVETDTETCHNVMLRGAARARSAALAFSGLSSVIKLVSFPGPVGSDLIGRLPQDMGLKTPEDYRISYRILAEGRGRQESRVLAVAVPEDDASVVMAHFASGLPAPYTLEISALAAITAFQQACGPDTVNKAVGLLEFGATVTTFSILNENEPVLIRRFDFGSRTLTARICKNLSVSESTARGIISDNAFDISEITSELLTPVINQIIVSRDFIERRENCRLSAMYASGGLMRSADVHKLLHMLLDTDIREWNPFDRLVAAPQALAGIDADTYWRFTGAVGAALGALEES